MVIRMCWLLYDHCGSITIMVMVMNLAAGTRIHNGYTVTLYYIQLLLSAYYEGHYHCDISKVQIIMADPGVFIVLWSTQPRTRRWSLYGRSVFTISGSINQHCNQYCQPSPDHSEPPCNHQQPISTSMAGTTILNHESAPLNRHWTIIEASFSSNSAGDLWWCLSGKLARKQILTVFYRKL